MFNPWQLLAGLVFGTLGWGAWRYGSHLDRWKPKAIGAVMMAYPYFVTNTVLLWVTGVILMVLFAMQHDA